MIFNSTKNSVYIEYLLNFMGSARHSRSDYFHHMAFFIDFDSGLLREFNPRCKFLLNLKIL